MKRIGVVGACRFTAIDAVVPTGINSLAPRCVNRTTACASSKSLLVHHLEHEVALVDETPSRMPSWNASTSDRS
jgi:hypothetical protein